MNKQILTEAVKCYQNGENEALAEIYEQTYSNLFVYAQYIMKDREKAEDLLQDTYLEVIKSIKNLKDPEAFLTWSKRIMYNLSCHAFGKTLKENVVADEEAAIMFDSIEEEDKEFIPEENFDAEEVQKIVRDIVEELPLQQRVAMVAYYFDELPIKQIADILDTSENTIKTRLFYGRKIVKTKIEAFEKKNDVRLHAIVSAPFLNMMMKQGAGNIASTFTGDAAANVLQSIQQTAQTMAGSGAASSGSGAGISVTAKATTAGVAAGTKITAKKIVAIIIAVCVATGGCIGGYIAYNHAQEVKKQEQLAKQQEAKEKAEAEEKARIEKEKKEREERLRKERRAFNKKYGKYVGSYNYYPQDMISGELRIRSLTMNRIKGKLIVAYPQYNYNSRDSFTFNEKIKTSDSTIDNETISFTTKTKRGITLKVNIRFTTYDEITKEDASWMDKSIVDDSENVGIVISYDVLDGDYESIYPTDSNMWNLNCYKIYK